jgi:DNA-binding response OmpR family regulator
MASGGTLLSPQRILIVEDDDDTRTFMTTMLRYEGHEVDAARSPAEALDLLHQRHYMLIVCDYMLPGITGTHLLQRARAEGLLDQTATMIATAHPEPEPFENTTVLRKPFDFEEFRQRVRDVLLKGRRSIGPNRSSR